MNIEAYIKSNVACNIISLLLRDCGYEVIPFRSDELLNRLASMAVKKTKISKTLFNIPQLVVVDKKGESILLSVKYTGQNKSGRNIDWGFSQIREHWPSALMTIVSNQEPYFLLADGESTFELSRSIFKINKKMSDKYVHLVRKFFRE